MIKLTDLVEEVVQKYVNRIFEEENVVSNDSTPPKRKRGKKNTASTTATDTSAPPEPVSNSETDAAAAAAAAAAARPVKSTADVLMQEPPSPEAIKHGVRHAYEPAGPKTPTTLKLYRDTSMHGDTPPEGEEPEVTTTRKAILKGKDYERKMAAAQDEFDVWDQERMHKLATARAKFAKAIGAKQPQEVSEETEAEHAKELGRNIKRYEKDGNAAHKAALAAAKKREAREKGDK